MTDYRYIFGSILPELVIEEIPCFGVIMDMEINKGGQFQGTFQLDQTGKLNADLIAATIPGKTFVSVERNGDCIWHGFIWSRVYSAQSKTMQLFGLSWENYPKKRIIRSNLTYTGADVRNIFMDLWRQLQAVPNGNVNVNVPVNFTPNIITTNLSVLATDFKAYDNVMSSLSDGVNGFDWYITVTKDGQFYRRDLQVGYPNLGSGVYDGMNVFEYPGNITQYYVTEPMADAGNIVYVIGAGEGSTMIVGTFTNATSFSSGFPVWETAINRKDINAQDLVNNLSMQLGSVLEPPMSVNKLTVKGNLTPVFGSYNLGDTCRIIIKDPRFPGNGYSANKRLLKWTLRPQSSDTTEEAELVFEGDPDL